MNPSGIVLLSSVLDLKTPEISRPATTCPRSSFAQIATVGTNVTSYQNTGLAASTSYSYRVRACNSAGNSGYSNTATATTPGVVNPPVAPSSLQASAASSIEDLNIDEEPDEPEWYRRPTR